MELNDDTGESAPRDPKLAGAQHKESKVCQSPPGTARPDAQPAPVWDNVDSDVALRRGIGYLHARSDNGYQVRISLVIVVQPISSNVVNVSQSPTHLGDSYRGSPF